MRYSNAKFMLFKYLASRLKKVYAKVRSDEDLWAPLLWTLFMSVIVIVYWGISGSEGKLYYFLIYMYVGVIVLNLWNQGRSRRILSGRRLSPLNSMGFEIENVKRYWGYKGTYRNYFIRIYYVATMDSYNPSRIWFVLYYKMPPGKSVREIQLELTSKYLDSRSWKERLLHFYSMQIREISIARDELFRKIWTFKQVKKRLDFLVDLAEKEGLQVMGEKEVDALIEADPDNAPYDHSEDFSK